MAKFRAFHGQPEKLPKTEILPTAAQSSFAAQDRANSLKIWPNAG